MIKVVNAVVENVPVFWAGGGDYILEGRITLMESGFRIKVEKFTIDVPVLRGMVFDKIRVLKMLKQNSVFFKEWIMLPKPISASQNRYLNLLTWIF